MLYCAYYKAVYSLYKKECACRGLLLESKLESKAYSANAKVFNIPVIRCLCGAEILLIRNAASTGKAIERHTQNCRLTKQSKNPHKCIEKLSRHLIKQVIDVAGEYEEIENKITKTP